MKYRLLPQATVDLESLGDYIASHDPRAAVRLVDALERRWDLLTLHPFSGAPRDDIAPGIRHSPCTGSAVMRSKFFACCMVAATSKPMTSARSRFVSR
ncbi:MULTISPECIES: type II toxin-antitoxin system RelE/ParE family toxin [unclassified Mesorhizobium]|uniref:type II toxin-antitoxin system RelE/ParE family toxin n=1 Tax=unclassified Mesorhizobium TaxID=325217 RepID=UPI001FE1EF85|nr:MULTISPECIES: type II toxin-antitoxin system RelE/ParE family toxin [unclassified Mesorhizobium]